MPLPDAIKKSPRVYTLLQNLDLENLSGDDLASVADPIAIEEANEDELRRLCLVAFARMVTKGSFDGWLTAAGGGDGPMLSVGPPSASYVYDLTGQSQGSQAANVAFPEDTMYLIPFSVPVASSCNDLRFNIASGTFAGTFYATIYSVNTSTNLPNTRVGSLSASISSTGDKTLSFGAGPTIGANSLHYAAISWERTSGTCSFGGGYFEYGRSGMPILASSAISTNSGGCLTYSASGAHPATLTQSSIGVFVGAAPKIRLQADAL